MHTDSRTTAAQYYDCNPNFVDDIPFYQNLLTHKKLSVLELGCGTGRVTLPLAPHCQYIQGIDISPAMIALCREKLANAGISASRAQVIEGDITNFELNHTFDLIIAPFRVVQNLATPQEIAGLFRCIRRHLGPHGSCILNAFKPLRDPEGMRQLWATPEEKISWEIPVAGGRLVCYDRKANLDAENLVLYPELIYRRYQGEALVDESVLKIAIKCYYPDTFERLITEHGFTVINRWGGYTGEVYGQGPELVIQFGHGDRPDAPC